MTWERLQDLKIRCLEHMGKNVAFEARDYWWKHYLKLDRLQKSLEDVPF